MKDEIEKKIVKQDRGSVTLVPFGNLAQRLLAISSSVAYFKSIDKPLYIVWFPSPEVNTRFERLFRLDVTFEEEEVTIHNATIKDYIFRDIPNNKNLYIPSLYSLLVHDLHLNCNKIKQNEDLQSSLMEQLSESPDSEIWMALNRAFYITPMMFENLSPSVEVLNMLRSFISGWPSKIIGVHIHRGSQNYSWRQNPTDPFIRKMQSLIESDPDIHFFLATDNYDDRDRIATIFGQRVFTPKTQQDAYTVSGAIQTYAEILALSQTEYIIGAKDNPYCLAASIIGNIDLEQVSIYA